VFAREGYPLIGGAFFLAVVLFVVVLMLPIGWGIAPLVLGLAAFGLTLYFFRDPDRTPPPEAESGNLLLAPADGKVVLMQDVEEPLYIKGPARQVSIFLSPLNVHVNRIPANGVIEFDQYVPGDYLVAWHPKASEKNERSQLGLRHPSGTPILFKQIAGAVARRIVYRIKVGDTVHAGERFGLVKFGSRMDVVIPACLFFNVKVGDRVTAGETVLGRLPEGPPEKLVEAPTNASEVEV